MSAREKAIAALKPFAEHAVLAAGDFHRAREALAALREGAGVAEDYKLVPVEPTEEMLRAGDNTFAYLELAGTSILQDADAEACYRAMLAASPPPQEAPATSEQPPLNEGPRPYPSPGLDRSLPDDRDPPAGELP